VKKADVVAGFNSNSCAISCQGKTENEELCLGKKGSPHVKKEKKKNWQGGGKKRIEKEQQQTE